MIEPNVIFIDDDALPPEQDWAVAQSEGQHFLFVKLDRATGEVLGEAAAAFRQLYD